MADYIKIRIRRGSTSDWTSNNPVLELGEIAVDMDKHGIKVGNGTSNWNDLPFCNPEIINNLLAGGTDKVLSAEQGKVLKEQLDSKASIEELTILETTLRQVIKDNDVDIVDRLDSSRAEAALSANMGRELRNMINAVASGGSPVEIADDLTTNDGGKALSAKQGVVLKGMIDIKANNTDIVNLEQEIQNIIANGGVEVVDGFDDPSSYKALSAKSGCELNEKIKNMSIFGMGYTVDNYNAYQKPTKITFSDGVTATLTWIAGVRLGTIKASTGEMITIDYDDNGLITGRTVTGGA